MGDPFRTQDSPLTGAVLFQLSLPDADWFWAEVLDAIRQMTLPEKWKQVGTVTIDEAVEAAVEACRTFMPVYAIGTIFAHALTDPPANSLPCDGTTYLSADYPMLAAVLDDFYHVDASHFKTPDLRGRVILGTGTGTGLSVRSLGDSLGEETHQLTSSEMPSHSHSYQPPGTSVPVAAPGEAPVTAINLIPSSTGSAGGDGSHNNMQPSHALHYAIWAR